MHAELVQVPAAGEAGHAALGHQQADAAVPGVGVGAGHDDHEVGELPVGDEGLLAVQPVAVPVADGGGPDALQVTARPGLGHGDGRDELTGAVAGQPPLFLLRRGQPVQVRADHVVMQLEHRAGGASPGQLLVQDHVIPVVRVAAAAVLLVDVDAEQPGPAGRAPHLAGDDPVLLPLGVVRRDLPRDEGLHHLAERVVFRGENLALHQPGPPPEGYPRVVVTSGCSRRSRMGGRHGPFGEKRPGTARRPGP